MWIEIAARNLRKNWRRSLFSILAICIGFAAVNTFGGFTAYIFENLRESFIYGAGNGHVTVFKRGFLEQGRIDPVRYLLDDDDQARILDQLAHIDGIEVVGRQLQIRGLASNGEVSTIFIAQGRHISAYNEMRTHASGLSGEINYRGKALADRPIHEVALSQGLSEVLNLDLGSDGMVTAPTVDGYVNALDFNVAQVFFGAAEGLDDKLLMVPLEFAQSLYDTDSVERINILLADDEDVDSFVAQLESVLLQAGLEVEVFSWSVLSTFYKKVKDMFDVLFAFLFAIVFLIASMSVVNMVSMSVLERTREIGTLRAMGANRRQILELLVVESALLAILGILAGVILTVAVWWAVSESGLTWVPPQYSTRIPLEVYLVPAYLALAAVVFLTLPVLSTLPPVWRAMRHGIVDALGHV